jgi:hypothetical protein
MLVENMPKVCPVTYELEVLIDDHPSHFLVSLDEIHA